ncbi:MAG: hypothetical protein ABDI07_10000 [Candidatus Kryptonium sp.]
MRIPRPHLLVSIPHSGLKTGGVSHDSKTKALVSIPHSGLKTR